LPRCTILYSRFSILCSFGVGKTLWGNGTRKNPHLKPCPLAKVYYSLFSIFYSLFVRGWLDTLANKSHTFALTFGMIGYLFLPGFYTIDKKEYRGFMVKKRLKVLIASVNNCKVPFAVMPLGACTVAEAASAAGHDVRLIDMMFEPDPAGKLRAGIEAFSPDVIGLSLRNIDNNDIEHPETYTQALKLAAITAAQNSKAPVVLGGAAVSVMPEQLLRFSGLQYAIVGNGEQAFNALLDRAAENREFGDLPGLASLVDGKFKLNDRKFDVKDSPVMPDLGRWLDLGSYRSQMASTPVQTKRGCPFQCIYCTYAAAEGAAYQLFSPESIAAGIKRLADSGHRDIEFVDNVFNAPPEHAAAVCRALIKAKTGASFQTLELNPLFMSDDLLSLMEQAGFNGIGITAESGSDAVLAALRKGYDSSRVRAAAEIAARHKIPAMWMFMLGGPGEDERTATETLEFARRHVRKTDVAFFNVGIRIYPGTGLERIARESGYFARPPEEMLEPSTYISPLIGRERLTALLAQYTNRHMNLINSNSIHFSFLPAIYKLARFAGVRPPIWKFTPFLRTGARLLGAEV
jgi:radical SAM superfamily enzyme YgiQ (UPF0313 family)